MRNAQCTMPNAKWSRGAAIAARIRRALRALVIAHCALSIVHSGPAVAAPQQPLLLDRILARIGGNEVTLTDLQTARGFGVVTGPSEEAALQQLIDRQLLLLEVARFPPPDPPETAVAAEVVREKAAAGARLQELMASTGTDDARLHDMARDTLRLEAYVDQRFGTSMQVTDDEAATYYGAHPDEFRRNGAAIPFEDALPVARERASIERRKEQVQRWLYDLRGRASIDIPR